MNKYNLGTLVGFSILLFGKSVATAQNYFQNGTYSNQKKVVLSFANTPLRCKTSKGVWTKSNNGESYCLATTSDILNIEGEFFTLETFGNNMSSCSLDGEPNVQDNKATMFVPGFHWNFESNTMVEGECEVTFTQDSKQQIQVTAQGSCDGICGHGAEITTSNLKSK